VTMFDNDDGIYKYRIYAYLVTSVVPLVLSSLAFVNPRAGYNARGAFCVLPTNPVWYQLVLAWIPRFIIAIAINGLAIAVYVQVEKKLRGFSASQRSSRTSLNGHMRAPPTLSKLRMLFLKRKGTISVKEDHEKHPPPPMLKSPQYNQGASVSGLPAPGLLRLKEERPEIPVIAKDYAQHDWFSSDHAVNVCSVFERSNPTLG
jgi:hypothetical protein